MMCLFFIVLMSSLWPVVFVTAMTNLLVCLFRHNGTNKSEIEHPNYEIITSPLSAPYYG